MKSKAIAFNEFLQNSELLSDDDVVGMVQMYSVPIKSRKENLAFLFNKEWEYTKAEAGYFNEGQYDN